MKEEKSFTASQVGVLIENLEKKIDTVLEIVAPIQEDIHILKEDVGQLKEDMTLVKNAVRLAIPSLTKRVEVLESKVR